jgi:hypothetical protein
MSDYDSIQEVGGADLARHYPDRGLIPDSNWYNAALKVETTIEGWRGWLKSLSLGNQAFLAVLSANTDGLRIRVSLYDFAIFIPWAEATVSAERGWAATVVRLKTAAVPSLALVFHVDDPAADDLLWDVVEPLPQRDPPRRLAWWAAEAWVLWVVLVLVVGLGAGVIAWLVLGRG